MKVVKEKMLTLPQVAEILAKESEKRELNSIELLTLEYAKKFSKLDPESASKLLDDLIEMGLPNEVAVQLVNVLPEAEDEVRTILAPVSRMVTGEQIRRILDKINEYKR